MTKTTLNLSDLSFGVMNPIGDTSADNSFDRRRSTLIHYLQKCISDAYAIDTLKKYDKFAGIIIQKEEIPRKSDCWNDGCRPTWYFCQW